MEQSRVRLFYPLACLCVLSLVDAYRISGASTDLSTDDTSNSEDLPGSASLDPETEVLVRACVGARAKDWFDLHNRVGIAVPGNHSIIEPLESVRQIYRVLDLMAERSAGKKWYQMISAYSSKVKQWKAEKSEAMTDLHSWNFDFYAATARCIKGMTDDAYACMLEKACPEPAKENCSSVQRAMRSRIDMRDLLVHLQGQHNMFQSKSQIEESLEKQIDELTQTLKEMGYGWKDNKKTCKKILKTQANAIKERVMSELSAGETIDDTCQEASEKMCPEGTYATTKRRYDSTKGATGTGLAYLISKFTLLPLGTAIGTAMAGPVGATAGFFAANMFVGPSAFAAGWWASRGPLECACFPRDCIYDNSTDTCHLDVEEVSSKNPYSAVLPMPGMKCTLAYKDEDKCSLQPCAAEEYTTPLGDVFGTIGPQGKSMYNCLSSTASQSGTLAVASALPDGQNNTIEGRNKIYNTLLGLNS